MKKSVLLLAAAFGVSGAFAQDLTSKKGEPFLPEAGDWSIGIDAAPFLNYAGQMLSNAGASAPTFGFNNGAFNNVIQGKMFKDEKTAYRAGVRLGFAGSKSVNEVAKLYADPAAAPTSYTFPSEAEVVENERKWSSKNIGLSAGLEMRRGKTRLQGFYGGEFGFGISGSKSKYTYGNALVAAGTTTPGIAVSAADAFAGAGNVTSATVSQGQGAGEDARVIESKGGGTFTVGLRGFIGAEYFIFPKMSIGGEFGWGLALAKTGATKTTYETRGMSSSATAQSVGSIEVVGSKSGGWSFDTQNINNVFGPAAQLRLNLHF